MQTRMFDKKTILSAILAISSLIGFTGDTDNDKLTKNELSGAPLSNTNLTKRPAIVKLNSFDDRRFFNITLPVEIRNYLLGIREKLNENQTIRDNLVWWGDDFSHISLVYGNGIDKSNIDQISEDIEKEILNNQAPFKMEFEVKPLKLFPTVIVASLKNTPEIKDFQQKLVNVVKKHVPSYRDLPFAYTPHITLGHFNTINDKTPLSSEIRKEITEIVSSVSNDENNQWMVIGFEFSQLLIDKTSIKPLVGYNFQLDH